MAEGGRIERLPLRAPTVFEAVCRPTQRHLPKLAEGAGIEPAQGFPSLGLASRDLTSRSPFLCLIDFGMTWCGVLKWCRPSESNGDLAGYESAALPIKLNRLEWLPDIAPARPGRRLDDPAERPGRPNLLRPALSSGMPQGDARPVMARLAGSSVLVPAVGCAGHQSEGFRAGSLYVFPVPDMPSASPMTPRG